MRSTLLAALAIGALTFARPLPAATVDVGVDPDLDRHPISELVYGVSFADWSTTVPYTVDRWGGNATSRYNWKVDTRSVGSDWYFMSFTNDDGIDPSQLPNGSSADQFLLGSVGHGSQPLLTVPLIGYTPKSAGLTVAQARQRRWAFSIDKYGPQLHNECADGQGSASWCQAPPVGNNEVDAGDGTCALGANCHFVGALGENVITGNDPLDTSDAITSTFVTDWMTHIAGVLGSSAATFYSLDNEPALWNSTHRDVHPAPLSYDELWTRTLAIAPAMKAANPNVEITGPVEWGWCSYFDQAQDAALGPSCVDGPDRVSHDGLPFLQWYLDQVCSYAAAHGGTRLVDYLDIHDYAQGTCVAGLGWGPDVNDVWHDCSSPFGETGAVPVRTVTGATVTGTVADLRFNALKEIYDPDWISDSWIGQAGEPPMQVVPRMRQWIADHCAGTGLAITEYRWGSDDGRSSALAQAEALALYGREGVDIATRWVAPDVGSASEDAFGLFLDYDRATAGAQAIGGDSVRARSSVCDPTRPESQRPCNVGSYAVRGAAGQLWVLLFNHDLAANDTHLTFATPVMGPATLFRFDPAAASNRITAAGMVGVAAGGLGLVSNLTLPARTATLVRVQLPPLGALPFSDGFEGGSLGRWSAMTP